MPCVVSVVGAVGCRVLRCLALGSSAIRDDMFPPLLLASHDGSFEPQPQADSHTLVESSSKNALEVLKVEFGQETQAAQCETEHWRDDSLEEPACIKHCSVASQCDGKVEGMWPGATHVLVPPPESFVDILAALLL